MEATTPTPAPVEAPAPAPLPRGRACAACGVARVVLARPKDGARLCKECFCAAFEADVHATIVRHGLFRPGERVAVAASGGKDSTVLAHVLSTLNARHGYGLDLFLLSVDEGIAGYRDDSLDTVRQNRDTYGLPLVVVSYKQLYGWSMDEVVKASGLRNNCTFCGVFRRQALDRGAVHARADKIVTGHNADDMAETVLMNLLRGDIARLGRCAAITTGGGSKAPASAAPLSSSTAAGAPVASAACASSGCGAPGRGCDSGTSCCSGSSDGSCSGCAAKPPAAAQSPSAPPPFCTVPRCKPLKYCFEKEIVLYAHHRKLVYHATECLYSPQAYRGFARELVKELEAVRPSAITDIVASAEGWQVAEADGGGGDDDDDGGLCGDARGGAVAGASTGSAGGGSRGRHHTSDAASVRSGGTASSSASSTTGGLTTRARVQSSCARCGYMTSAGSAGLGEMARRTLCQACTLLAGLEAGTPRVALGDGRHARRAAAGVAAASSFGSGDGSSTRSDGGAMSTTER